jgi:hypothetical protein
VIALRHYWEPPAAGGQDVHDFGKLVYLDPPKTGSTYISRFLKECCTLPEVEFRKHGMLPPESYREDCFYFISARDPFDLYMSLYRFGCDKKGAIYQLLKQNNLDKVYEPNRENFEEWVQLVTTSETFFVQEGKEFEGGYDFAAKAGIGLMTFRFLRLCLFDPKRSMLKARTWEKLLEHYQQHSIANCIIRQDRFNEELWDLSTQRLPEYFDRDKVEDFIARSATINASKARVVNYFKASPIARDLVRKREHFLFKAIFND